MPKEVHIDTTGMSDTEKITAMLTEIVKYIPVKAKKKAKEIREENRRFDKPRKKHMKHEKARWKNDETI